MKKYTRPTIEIVELQANQNLCADQNPIKVTTVTTGNTTTTVYNLALLSTGSVTKA